MTNPLYAIDQLPTTSAAAIREFSDRFIAGAGAGMPSTWGDFGETIPTDSPMLTFPISALGLKYQRAQGEHSTKMAKETSFDVKTEEFEEGIEAKLIDLYNNVFAYRKWLTGPQRLLIEEQQHVLRNIAALLALGPATNCWDGTPFFGDSHPCNIGDDSKGTFDNLNAAALDVVSLANIEAQCTQFMLNAKDEQGELVDSKPDTIFVSTAKFMALSNLLGQALVPNGAGTATMNNPFYGGMFNVVAIPQSFDADGHTHDWMLFDSKRAAASVMPPWLVLKQTVPAELALRTYEPPDTWSKDTGRIKVVSHIWEGFALAFPHCIRLIKGA